MLSREQASAALLKSEIIFSEQQVQAAVVRMAREINEVMADVHPLVLSVMGGAVVEPNGKERPRRRNTREDLTNHLDSPSPDLASSPIPIAFSSPVSEDTICPFRQIFHIATVTYDLDGCIGSL